MQLKKFKDKRQLDLNFNQKQDKIELKRSIYDVPNQLALHVYM